MAPDSAVDWQVVQAELEEINEAWQQARFDSLPHVVEILTSQVPEEAIQILQEQRDAIEDIVDDVVRGYHNGFNKAFHNYSQILRVFGESAASISGLKENLNEARKLLGARNKQLQQLWCRSVTIRHIISLLDQIDNVAKVPSRIEKLIAEKRYYAAVQLHLQSTGLLDREGLQGVGALQDVRSDLSKLRGTLFFRVIDDLQLYLYNMGEYSIKPILDIDIDDDISNILMANVPVSNGHPVSRRTRTMRRNDNQLEGHLTSNGFHHTSSIDGSSSADGREEDSLHFGDNFDGNMSEGVSRMNLNRKEPSDDEAATKETRWSRSGLPSWLAESTPNEFIDLMTKSKAPLHIKYLQTMVECLGLLGKVAAAGAIISQKLRPAIHELITEEIKARAAAIDACRPRLDQVSRTVSAGSKINRITVGAGTFSPKHVHHSGGNAAVGCLLGTGPLGPFMGALGRGQAAAQEILESILGLILRVLENHVIVGEMMEIKSANQGDASSPRKMNGDLSWNADPDIARATGGYSLSFALTVIQSECQQLICDILRATPDAATADAAVQTARLASKLPRKDSIGNCTSDDGLSFAFRFTDTVFSTGDGLRQRRNAAAQEGYGTGAVLSERGFYLIAAVYKPTLQFTDKVLVLLPPKYTQLGKDGLQSFVENFVKDQFLPLVRVDYRTRVQDALASPAAFRPKSRAGILYESSVEKGRPVLQGPQAASYLADEVVSWAQAMPKYAGDFVEVAQALLERTLERCRAAYTEAVLGSLSSSIIGRSDVENLMRQESASTLLDASYLMQLGRRAEESFDAGMEVETEIDNLLLSYRPVKQDQLIGDDQKLILMAALSDSLEYVSESIEKLGQNTSACSLEKKKKDAQHFPHHRRSSSALTTSLRILAEKYRSLSAECLRTLRVEMQLEAIHHLQCMSERGYMMDLDAEEPEDFIMALTMQVTRLDEEMMPYIPVHKRTYMFGGICGVVATFLVKALNDMGTINLFGVRQICRNCIAVEQALAALSSSNSETVCQQLNRVRNYYELLNLPFEALIAFVSEHYTVYSFSEYSSLLKVNVAGREVPVDGVQRIGKLLAPVL